jgi:ankyrin repeat protein
MYNGFSPLLIAAQEGHVDVVRCLVESGAGINQTVHHGVSPLYIATLQGHVDVVRYLVSDLGTDVNQAMNNGDTPLHIAVQMGNFDVVRCLVSDLGADVNQAHNIGETLLMRAARMNNKALIRHLVHKGAHVRAVTKSGHTAVSHLKSVGATAEQIVYLEARECCASPGCDSGGRKCCAVFKETRYCGISCRIAH